MKLRATTIIVALIICLSACQRTQHKSADNAGQPAAANQKHFEFKGKVVEISDRDKKSAKIAHETIRNGNEVFMEAMTMKFAIKDDANFGRLEVGDQINATLVYNPDDNRSWLENLTITKNKSQ